MHSPFMNSSHTRIAFLVGSLVIVGCARHHVVAARADVGPLVLDGLDAGSLDGALDATRDAALDGPREMQSSIGAACSSASDCGAPDDALPAQVPACLRIGVWPNGNGWTNGYCASACTATVPISDGARLERLDCPSGALCVPLEEENGICLRACETDSDCRTDEFYFCRKDFRTAGTTSNGICMPLHCQSRGCSGSARCEC